MTEIATQFARGLTSSQISSTLLIIGISCAVLSLPYLVMRVIHALFVVEESDPVDLRRDKRHLACAIVLFFVGIALIFFHDAITSAFISSITKILTSTAQTPPPPSLLTRGYVIIEARIPQL